MCGLWGFVAHRPEPEIIREVALAAASRGPHGHGFAWRNTPEDPTVGVYKSRRHLKLDLDALEAVHASALVIGHARLATSGSINDLDDYHPHTGGGSIYVVHNGNVYNLPMLLKEFGITLHSRTDSEIIAHIIERNTDYIEGTIEAIRAVSPRSKLALLVLTPTKVIAARRGHPLYVVKRSAGLYVSSRRVSSSDLLPDDAAHVMGLGQRDSTYVYSKHML